MPESKGDSLLLRLSVADGLTSNLQAGDGLTSRLLTADGISSLTSAGDTQLVRLLIADVESSAFNITTQIRGQVFPVAISSGELFGTPVKNPQVIFPSGIVSSEVFGSSEKIGRLDKPVGISSKEAFGRPILFFGAPGLPGHAFYDKAFQDQGPVAATQTVSPRGIVASETWGRPAINWRRAFQLSAFADRPLQGDPTPATPFLDDLGLLALGNADSYQTNKDKYQTIIAGNWSAMLALPGQELVYSSGLQVEDGNPVELGKVTARAGGYLAHTSTGAEIPYFAGGNGLICDSGNVGFQNDTATLILNWLAGAGAGVNGIFFDNFIMDITSVGASYPVYSQGWNGTSGGSLIWNNETDFQNAIISFITNVGTKLKNAGYAVVVNARGVAHLNDIQDDNGTTTNSWMDRYYPYVTGMMVEYWQQDGSNRNVELTGDDSFVHHWDGWQSVIAKCNTRGIGPYPLSYSGSEPNELVNQTFLRASFLMEWDGVHGCWLTGSDVGAFTPADAWSTVLATDVGLPVSQKVAVGSCWRRQYDNKLVYVNPTQSTQSPDGHSMASGTGLFV